MAVLKRFSYDNIVEHNPTAPDPVEGGGSGGADVVRFLFLDTDDGITTEATSENIYNAYSRGALVFADFGFNDPEEGFMYMTRNMSLRSCDMTSYAFVSMYSSNGVFFVRSIEYELEAGLRLYEKQVQTSNIGG